MPDTIDKDLISFPWLNVVLLMLAGVAGSIDAMGYFKLGHVLPANMTGNSVLLGLAIGQGKASPAIRSLIALAGFVVGVALGSAIVNLSKKKWHALLSFSLLIEFALILIMTVSWWVFMDKLPVFIVFTSILLSAIAMGIQSSTIRHLHIPGVVTTYLSGTITVVVSELVRNFRRILREVTKPQKTTMPVKLEERIGLQLLIFITYLGMAAITAIIYKQGLDFLPIIPLVLLMGVVFIIVARVKKTSN